MPCDCMMKVDELLKPRNTRLQTCFIWGSDASNAGKLVAVPHIGTEQIEKGRGKKKAIGMMSSFCCFCGVAYELPDQSVIAAQEGGA